jgi:predicted aspartyl protease
LIAPVVVALTLGGAPPTFAKCILQKLADLPVTMVGLRPVVSAKINGVDVKLFIDTGSFANTLNPEIAARIGLRLTDLPPEFQVEGLTGEARMRLARARDFTFLGAELHQAEFLVAEHGLGGADGLIGQQIMGKFDVEYDFAKGVARLFVPKDCPANASLGYWDPGRVGYIPIHPIDAPQTDIVGEARVNGAKIRVVFDSGTPRSALTLDAARRAGVRLDAPGVEYAEVSGGAGDRVIDTWIAPFDSFSIGDETVKKTRLRLGRFELDDGDMLLGTDFFLSHHIYVARSQNRLYFSYNGGPVFNLEQEGAPKLAPSEPSPAAGGAAADGAPAETADFLARRAAAALARHQYDAAIADDSRAIALEPTEARHFYDRGVARRLDDQSAKAMDDFDAALKLAPADVPALVARGVLRLENKDAVGASSTRP